MLSFSNDSELIREPQTKNVDYYWQFIRGIAIVCVILIHCKSVIALDFDSFDSVFYLVCRNLINFSVALFLHFWDVF